jgi:multidrug efflux pump subunit AcrA (membrane-fusion protein)
VEITGTTVEAAVSVPESAVLDSGTRRLAFVAHEGGRFEAREVELGARADNYVAIEHGVAAGEAVVAAGNFLIDAESNLRAGTTAFGHSHGDETNAPSPPTAPQAPAHADHTGH